MNRLEFTATIAGALFWPLGLVIIAVLFRRPLAELLPRVRSARIGPISFDVGDDLRAAAAAAHVALSAPQLSIIEQRLRRAMPKLRGATVLWVDDNPAGNVPLVRILNDHGVRVLQAKTTDDALDIAGGSAVDVVISDMDRGGDPRAGLQLLAKLPDGVPVLFYLRQVQANTPPGAIGITNRPDELLHLTLDILERRRHEGP
ncbi:MAG: response regulator [Vicinamibacterales bacterium]